MWIKRKRNFKCFHDVLLLMDTFWEWGQGWPWLWWCPQEAAADRHHQLPPAPHQGGPCSAMACPGTWGQPPPNMGGLEGRVAQEQNIPGGGFVSLHNNAPSAEPSRDILWQTQRRFIALPHGAGGEVVKKVCPLSILVGLGVDFQQGPNLQTAIHAHSSEEQADTQIHRG